MLLCYLSRMFTVGTLTGLGLVQSDSHAKPLGACQSDSETQISGASNSTARVQASSLQYQQSKCDTLTLRVLQLSTLPAG